MVDAETVPASAHSSPTLPTLGVSATVEECRGRFLKHTYVATLAPTTRILVALLPELDAGDKRTLGLLIHHLAQEFYGVDVCDVQHFVVGEEIVFETTPRVGVIPISADFGGAIANARGGVHSIALRVIPTPQVQTSLVSRFRRWLLRRA